MNTSEVAPHGAKNQELVRVADAELVDDTGDSRGSWESLVSEWYTGVSQELVGALRQMRAAAYVKHAYGKQGLEKFSEEVKAKKSKTYAYAACFERLHKAYGDEVSGRLESSPLSPWQVVEAAHNGDVAGDIPEALDRAEEMNLSTRDLRAERNGEKRNVETITEVVCPECSCVYPLSRATTREVAE